MAPTDSNRCEAADRVADVGSRLRQSRATPERRQSPSPVIRRSAPRMTAWHSKRVLGQLRSNAGCERLFGFKANRH